MKNIISLSELNSGIKKSIQNNFSELYYIVAEISELNESRGHAYIELIEKDESDTILAKARATIWARTYRMLKPYFETTTGHQFQSGLKVLLVVNVEFHEVYGFSLNIKDIDPNYTIGDIERKRLLIIQRLESEGVMNMNKELDIPIVPQKIAVISSETAAGYGDFINQLNKNEYGFKFYIKLFQAAMQGENTEKSIITALEKVYEYEEIFDIVVIIRGGGSKSDLSWFDSYQLALNISQFPLPVLTGIGHEKDHSITDMVAHTSLKTPTAVAHFLINYLLDFNNYLNKTADNFKLKIQQRIDENKNNLGLLISNFKPIINEILFKKRNELLLKQISLKNNIKNNIQNQFHLLQKYPQIYNNTLIKEINKQKQTVEFFNLNLKNYSKKLIIKHQNKLEILNQKNIFLSPKNILKRGYSLTLLNGKPIKSIKTIKPGNIITTKLIDGEFNSKVEN